MLKPPNRPVVLDLFCGCGGLSLGAEQAGFRSALSIDQDVNLTSSFGHNFPSSNLRIADIGRESVSAIKAAVGSKVDGVIGGPPCQGFSSIGRRDEDDPRRGLLIDFFRIVKEVSPKFFLMENVRGLSYERNSEVLQQGLQLLPKRYRVIGPMLLNSADFGAATKRPRIFVFGYDINEMQKFDSKMFEGGKSPATVRDAIADLEHLKPLGQDAGGYDLWSSGEGHVSSYAQRLRGKTKRVTGHRKTPHKREIANRFATVPQGGKDEIGKHVRLAWTGQCPTLRAGTGPDRGSYQAVRPLHPSENRVITVREAARLQGFPDRFLFHPTTWHSFRMIGNSVSPVIAHGILSVIYDGLKR